MAKTRNRPPRQSRSSKDAAKKRPVRMTCPYCGKAMHYRSAEGIYKENGKNHMLYVCSGYPVCDTYVKTMPGTCKPAGTPANGDLRRLRIEAHHAFDRLWKSNIMTRSQAYRWLEVVTCMPERKAHIGTCSDYMCRFIIDKSNQFMLNQRRNIQVSEALAPKQINAASVCCASIN